jgi:hypothetical protein
MGHQRGPVHQQRFDMTEAVSQLVENGEAVSVDISPVADAALGESPGFCQRIPSVTGAKYDDGTSRRRKRQEVRLILGDENPTDGHGQRGEAVRVDRNVGQPEAWSERNSRHAG